MELKVNLNNQIRILSEISNEVSAVQNIPSKVIGTSSAVNLESKQSSLNKEMIIQLQEVHEITILQISSKKDDIDFNGIPSIEWLKGRDDKLYDKMSQAISVGRSNIKIFDEIINRTKNDNSISYKDWHGIERGIRSFEMGVLNLDYDQSKTNDPIVLKVLNHYILKTQNRINIFKQFLVGKICEDRIDGIMDHLVVPNNLNAQTATDSSSFEVTKLLDFLVKNLRWYTWYLEDQKDCSTTYSLQFFHLTQSINYISTIGEV